MAKTEVSSPEAGPSCGVPQPTPLPLSGGAGETAISVATLPAPVRGEGESVSREARNAGAGADSPPVTRRRSPSLHRHGGHQLISDGDGWDLCVLCGGNGEGACDPDRPRCESCRQSPASIREPIRGHVFLVCGSCRNGGKVDKATCPWCAGEIKPSDDTARAHGLLFHAGCLEELELERSAG